MAILTQGGVGALLSCLVWTTLMTVVSCNVLGLLPYCFGLTSLFGVGLAVSIGLSLGSVALAVVRQREASLDPLLPRGCPLLISVPVVVVEALGLVARSVALGVRLAANIVAGHTLLSLMAGVLDVILTVLLLLSGPLAGPTAALGLASAILICMEVVVSGLQAYVFVLLLARIAYVFVLARIA